MIYSSGQATGRPHRARGAAPAWRHALTVLALVAYLAMGIGGLRALWTRWQAARFAERGIAFGPRGLAPGMGVDPWGVNVDLEQHCDEQALGRSLDLVAAGGFHWVRQRFLWAEIEPERGSYRWERWDAIVRQCQARGLRLIAVLDSSPQWARTPADAANPLAPPRNPADLATFARALAQRYGQAIDYYQVWDEPNIYPHWGERDADPAGYLALLRAARTQVRDVDPTATLILAGLAPTWEEHGRNLSEVLYLRGLYAAGGRGLFDVVAGKPFGFWTGPEDRQVTPSALNFSRLVALHEEMVRQGDGAKPLWAVAWGWNALPPGWEGQPSPWGSDAAPRQHDRDLRAIQRAREEWPWLGLMCYAAWQPAAPADDPAWGFALLDAQGNPGPLYRELQSLAREQPVLFPGCHTLPLGATASSSPVELRFWGNQVHLRGPGRWQLLELDGRPLNRTLQAGSGLAAAVRGLTADEHRLLLRPLEPIPAVQVVVSRERPPWLPLRQAAAVAALALLGTGALWHILKRYPWRRWLACGVGAYRGLSPWAAFGVGAAGVAALALAPQLALSLAALAAVALLVVVGRPDVGLQLAVFLVPLAPLQKQFGPARFSYLEMLTLLAVAGYVGQDMLALLQNRRERPPLQSLAGKLRTALRQANALDAGFALLVAASLLSLLASERLWVSVRELRVVILQAAFLYWLVVRGRLNREGILHLVDLLILSGAVISLHGLFQYIWTQRVIVAEGVRRMRGIYGSPNNLALVLGRLFPLMLAFALRGPRGWRQWAYALAAVPAAVCLFLTFSRGAWLLGIPASLLVLGLLAGRRARAVAIGLAAVGILSLAPLLGTARLGSLFHLQGTSLLRVKLWEAAWEMARDHPIFGVGLDNFLYQYPRYIRPEAMNEPNLSHPHNVLLDFWLRLGVPGLVAFGWLEWHFFRRAVAAWRRLADPALWAVAIGLLAAMADMLAHGLIDASFFVVELAALFALMAALVRRLGELADGPR